MSKKRLIDQEYRLQQADFELFSADESLADAIIAAERAKRSAEQANQRTEQARSRKVGGLDLAYYLSPYDIDDSIAEVHTPAEVYRPIFWDAVSDLTAKYRDTYHVYDFWKQVKQHLHDAITVDGTANPAFSPDIYRDAISGKDWSSMHNIVQELLTKELILAKYGINQFGDLHPDSVNYLESRRQDTYFFFRHHGATMKYFQNPNDNDVDASNSNKMEQLRDLRIYMIIFRRLYFLFFGVGI